MKHILFFYFIATLNNAFCQPITTESGEQCKRYDKMITAIKKDFITNRICAEKDLNFKIDSLVSRSDSMLKGNLELISLDMGITKDELLKWSPDELRNLTDEYNKSIARDANQFISWCLVDSTNSIKPTFQFSFICFNPELFVVKTKQLIKVAGHTKYLFYIFKFSEEGGYVFRKEVRD